MASDLPEPRVAPTPAPPPISGRVIAVGLILGVAGLFVGLAHTPQAAGEAASAATQPIR